MWHWQQDQVGKILAKHAASLGEPVQLNHTADRFTITVPKTAHAAEIIINYAPSEVRLGLGKMQPTSGIGNRLAKVDTSIGRIVVHQILSEPEIHFDLSTLRRDESVMDLSYTFITEDNASIASRAVTYKLKPLPKEFALKDNYPNPFNPSTRIDYDLVSTEKVRVVIYNIAGQEVTRLVNTTQEAGYHSVVWTGSDAMGAQVAAGIYFYQIQAGTFVQTKKMLFLK